MGYPWELKRNRALITRHHKIYVAQFSQSVGVGGKLICNVNVCDSNTKRKTDMTFLDGMLIYIVCISSDTATWHVKYCLQNFRLITSAKTTFLTAVFIPAISFLLETYNRLRRRGFFHLFLFKIFPKINVLTTHII